MAAGFDCEFTTPPPHCIQTACPICLFVLKEPYQATCCGKSFCKACIEQIKGSRKSCPACTKRGRGFSVYPNLGLQQSLYDFQVYCTHKSKGCEWTGELKELDNHLNSNPPADKSLEGCPLMLINCPLSCAGCEKGLCRKDVKSHVNDRLLSQVMTQRALNSQFEQHVTIMKAKVSELEVKNKELEDEVRELKSKQSEKSDQPISEQQPGTHVTGTYKPIGAEFTMTNFDEYKRDNDKWYSPHFFTHPNGYKMCLEVHANGSGGGKGTHLSVGLCLIQGEFDDQLKWPFRGAITIKLVNQEEDRNHVAETVNFTGSTPGQHCKRVRIAEPPRGAGWGLGKFLSLVELQPKYLKNDCIKLCIKKVEIF